MTPLYAWRAGFTSFNHPPKRTRYFTHAASSPIRRSRSPQISQFMFLYTRPVDDIAFLGCRLVSSASNCHRLRYAEVPGHLHCDKDPSLGCRSQLFCRQPTSLEQSITWAESWTGEFNRLLEKHLIVYCWNSDVYLQLPCMFIVCRVYMNLRRVTGRECLVWI